MKPRSERWWARRWRWIGAGAALFVGAAVMAYALTPLPAALTKATPATLTLVDVHGTEIAELPSTAARYQQPVALAQMGRWLPEMAVALEDRRFREHRGIDWRATAGSV